MNATPGQSFRRWRLPAVAALCLAAAFTRLHADSPAHEAVWYEISDHGEE
jgi:hypothetical protein